MNKIKLHSDFTAIIIICLLPFATKAQTLDKAIEKGDIKAVSELSRSKTKVNEADKNGATPLMLACNTGNPEIVKILLENGADINAADNKHRTALMLAAGNTYADKMYCNGK